jgi:sugar phosphate permease
MNAVTLQSVVFNGAAFIGPTLGALTLALFTTLGQRFAIGGNLAGYAGNFFLNGISFLGVLGVLYLLRIPKEAAQESRDRRGPLLESIRESLRFVRKDAALPWILSGYAALLFFGPSTSLILPIFATQILHVQPFQLGLLFSASGLGVILGALIVASLGDFKHKGLLLLVSFLIWSIALIAFGVSKNFWFSMLMLLVLGIGQNGVGSSTITLLQTRVPPYMRGRVMSLNTLSIMGVRPLGDFPASGLIAFVGGPLTVVICASIVGLYSLSLLIWRPVIRTL